MAIEVQLCQENLGFPMGWWQNWMESGYEFNQLCFNLQQKQQQQDLLILQQEMQIPKFENSGLFSTNSNCESIAFSHSAAAQIEKQRQEIDQLITSQNKRLRLILEEERSRQVILLMRKYEEKMVVLLNRREEEISKAMNRTMELEDFLRRMEIENQTWQRVAKENETMVDSLNTQIEQLKENGFFTNGVEDAESCCDLINRGEKEDETGENMGPGVEQENDEQKTIKMVCKSCNCRNSSVIFIPCKHLCSCKPCQASLDSCPVCGMVKKAYVEALF